MKDWEIMTLGERAGEWIVDLLKRVAWRIFYAAVLFTPFALGACLDPYIGNWSIAVVLVVTTLAALAYGLWKGCDNSQERRFVLSRGAAVMAVTAVLPAVVIAVFCLPWFLTNVFGFWPVWSVLFLITLWVACGEWNMIRERQVAALEEVAAGFARNV
jgi:hypothetical protein